MWRTLLLTILMVGLIYCAQAQEQFNIENFLPPKTLVYLSIPNGEKYLNEMENTGFVKLLGSKEWQEFFNQAAPDFIKKFKEQKAMIESQLGISLETLRQSFSGQISLALADVVISEQAPMPMPIVVISWDLGAKKEEFAKFFKETRMKAYQFAPNKIEETVYQVNGQDVTQIMGPMPIFITYIGNVLIICSDKNYVESMLQPEKAQKETLATFERYTTVKKNLLQDRVGKFAYINVKDAKELGMKFAGPQAAQIQGMLQLSGLDSIDALGLGVSFQNGQAVESVYIHTPAGRTGIFGDLFPAVNLEQKLVKFIPNKPIAVYNGFINLEGLYKTAMNLFKQFAGPREQEMFEMQKQGLEKNIGASIEEILGSLGNEYLHTVSFSGGFIPDIAFQLALKDTAKFTEIFQKLVNRIPPKYRYNVQWNGHNFTYFNFSTLKEPIPFAPAVAIENDRVVIAPFPETLKNILSQTNGQLPQELVKQLGDKKYTYCEFVNLKDTLIPLYRTIVPLAQALVPRHKAPIELALLPSGDTLEAHLSNIMFIGTHDQQGLLWQIHSPAGILPLMVISSAVSYMNFKRQMMHGRRPRFEDPKPFHEEKKTEENRSEENKSGAAEPDKKEGESAAAPSKALEGNLLALEETRNIKMENPNLSEVLSRIWLSDTYISAQIFASIPKNAIGFGNFKFTKIEDNLGTKMTPKKDQSNTSEKFSSYDLESVQKGNGYVFKVQFTPPARNATTFSAKGTVNVRVGDGTEEIKLPEIAEMKKKEKYEVDTIPGLKIVFTELGATNITMHVEGDIVQISDVEIVHEKDVQKPSSWSSYTSDGKMVMTYWYPNNIQDKANIVIRYIKKLEIQQVDFNIENQKLP